MSQKCLVSVLSSCDGLLNVPIGQSMCSSGLAVPVHVGMGTGQVLHADSVLGISFPVIPCAQDNVTCQDVEGAAVPGSALC